MKKFKLIALAAVLTLIPTLQSCLDDDDSSYPSLAISTIKTLEGVDKGYYFGLDDNTKLYPGDTTAIHNYALINGQRAFVQFYFLDEPKTGYDYNVKVEQIINILTKDIVDLTEENAEDIGDNNINATSLWITQGYLNIEFQYFGTNNPDKKHFLNLVRNTLATGENDEEGYISLEFRHNVKGDSPDRPGEGYVSFKLDKIAEEMKDAKGLKVRVKTLYDGERFYKIDFKKEKSVPTSMNIKVPSYTNQTIY